jgi:hypothetical protein
LLGGVDVPQPHAVAYEIKDIFCLRSGSERHQQRHYCEEVFSHFKYALEIVYRIGL